MSVIITVPEIRLVEVPSALAGQPFVLRATVGEVQVVLEPVASYAGEKYAGEE